MRKKTSNNEHKLWQNSPISNIMKFMMHQIVRESCCRHYATLYYHRISLDYPVSSSTVTNLLVQYIIFINIWMYLQLIIK